MKSLKNSLSITKRFPCDCVRMAHPTHVRPLPPGTGSLRVSQDPPYPLSDPKPFGGALNVSIRPCT